MVKDFLRVLIIILHELLFFTHISAHLKKLHRISLSLFLSFVPPFLLCFGCTEHTLPLLPGTLQPHTNTTTPQLRLLRIQRFVLFFVWRLELLLLLDLATHHTVSCFPFWCCSLCPRFFSLLAKGWWIPLPYLFSIG